MDAHVGVAQAVAVTGLFLLMSADYSGKCGEQEETATVLVHGLDAITIEVPVAAITAQKA